MRRTNGSRLVALAMLGLAVVVVTLAARQQGALNPHLVWMRGPVRQRVALQAGMYQVYDQLYDDDTEPPDDFLIAPAEPQLIGPVRSTEPQLGAQVVAGRESWLAWIEPDWEAPSGYSPQDTVRVRASGDYRVQDLTLLTDDEMVLGPLDSEYRQQTLSLIVNSAAVLGILLGLVIFWRRAPRSGSRVRPVSPLLRPCDSRE